MSDVTEPGQRASRPHPDMEAWGRTGLSAASILFAVWQMLSSQIGDIADDLDAIRDELRSVSHQAAQLPELTRRVERLEAELIEERRVVER